MVLNWAAVRGLLLDPAIAADYGGAEVLGLLLAAPAAGSILAAMSSGWSRHVHRHGRALAPAAAGWGVAIVAFGFAGVTAGAREDAGRAVVG